MSNEFTREEGELVGAIRPAPDGGEPVFRIIPRNRFAEPGGLAATGDENVRPCEHIGERMGFTLDEQWKTVTCKICKQHVDAFSVLMLYATWYERIKREQLQAEHNERSAHVARLHKIKDRRALTAKERGEVIEAINRQYAMKAKDVGALASRMEKALRQRKQPRANRA